MTSKLSKHGGVQEKDTFDISGARMSGLRMGGRTIEVVDEMRSVGFGSTTGLLSKGC